MGHPFSYKKPFYNPNRFIKINRCELLGPNGVQAIRHAKLERDFSINLLVRAGRNDANKNLQIGVYESPLNEKYAPITVGVVNEAHKDGTVEYGNWLLEIHCKENAVQISQFTRDVSSC